MRGATWLTQFEFKEVLEALRASVGNAITYCMCMLAVLFATKQRIAYVLLRARRFHPLSSWCSKNAPRTAPQSATVNSAKHVFLFSCVGLCALLRGCCAEESAPRDCHPQVGSRSRAQSCSPDASTQESEIDFVSNTSKCMQQCPLLPSCSDRTQHQGLTTIGWKFLSSVVEKFNEHLVLTLNLQQDRFK